MTHPKQDSGCPGCSRRQFIALGGALAALSLSSGCGPATLDGEVRVALADYPTLQMDGGLATIPSNISNFDFDIFVHRNGDSYVAMSAECTHAGCPVAPRAQQLYCSCHGSTFSLDGLVLNGPASEPLNRFKVAVEGDELVITG